jgi:hypothetical protein
VSAPPPAPPEFPPRRRAQSNFTPRFTLSLIYLFGFFFLYCLFGIGPALLEAYANLPPGIDEATAEQIAAKVAQQAVQPRLLLAFIASVFTVTLGAHFKLLPGLKA